MKAFAKTLADLHQIANHTSIQDFPAEAIHLVKNWIAFDGAVLGMGQAEAGAQPKLEIAEAYVYNREQSILTDYAGVSAIDPVTRAFLKGLANPFLCDCSSLYASRELDELNAFLRRHDLCQLMIFGNPPAGDSPARWLVTYRGSRTPFSATDAEYLHALWLHLSIAINMNRMRALDGFAPSQIQRARALISLNGTILAADPMFYALLRKEWPDYQEIKLPGPVADSYARKGSYRGRYIDISFAEQFGCIACSARMSSAFTTLSPAENRVATLFSVGLSQKQVAQELGVSEHTVRSQLKSSYSKLGVHDKAALTRYVVSHS